MSNFNYQSNILKFASLFGIIIGLIVTTQNVWAKGCSFYLDTAIPYINTEIRNFHNPISQAEKWDVLQHVSIWNSQNADYQKFWDRTVRYYKLNNTPVTANAMSRIQDPALRAYAKAMYDDFFAELKKEIEEMSKQRIPWIEIGETQLNILILQNKDGSIFGGKIILTRRLVSLTNDLFFTYKNVQGLQLAYSENELAEDEFEFMTATAYYDESLKPLEKESFMQLPIKFF